MFLTISENYWKFRICLIWFLENLLEKFPRQISLACHISNLTAHPFQATFTLILFYLFHLFRLIPYILFCFCIFDRTKRLMGRIFAAKAFVMALNAVKWALFEAAVRPSTWQTLLPALTLFLSGYYQQPHKYCGIFVMYFYISRFCWSFLVFLVILLVLRAYSKSNVIYVCYLVKLSVINYIIVLVVFVVLADRIQVLKLFLKALINCFILEIDSIMQILIFVLLLCCLF